MAETRIEPANTTGKKTPAASAVTRKEENPANIKIFGSRSAKMGENIHVREGLILRPNAQAKDSSIEVRTSDDGKTMEISFSGNGWEIDARDVQKQLIYRETDFSRQVYQKDKTTPPERVVVTVDGNNNRFHGTPIGAEVHVNGDGNIIQTSNSEDNITINGNSNIVAAYSGNDNVTIEQGSGNSVYLGNGNDSFTAPKDSVANFVWSGALGHDSVRNGTYIKNKDLRKNNIDVALTRAKQTAAQAQSTISDTAGQALGTIASAAGKAISSIPEVVSTYFNGGTDEEWETFDNLIKESAKEKFRENCGDNQ